MSSGSSPHPNPLPAGEGISRRPLTSSIVDRVRPSGIRKFFDVLATMEHVISLGIGEPDFVTPEHIRQAGTASVDEGHTHYTSNYGLVALRRRIADHLEAMYRVSYDPETE